MSNDLAGALEELLTGLTRAVQAEGIDQLAELDISISQVRSLLVLRLAGQPLPIHRIADEVGLSVASAGRNVDRLVALDLVSRTENPDDRRVKLIDLTTQGQELLEDHFAPKRAALRAFAGQLPDDIATELEAAIRGALATGALNTETGHTTTGEPS